MPALTFPATPRYQVPPPTSHNLEWAHLQIIDLSQADTPDGRAHLAKQVRDAMVTTGFFYVINHGYTPEENSRITDIADVPFERVSLEEKQVYDSQPKVTGSYQGYKLRSYWHIENGVRDQIESYNMNRDLNKREHPEALRPFLPEIAEFARFNHFQVLHPVLRLMALGLELPENYLVDIHNFYSKGETYVRLMKYYPRTDEDEERSKNVWLKGHTDFGSVTILWSQPISALQILSPDGKWRWIKHLDNALVINAGDCLEFLSGGFYKATIHRVVQPPPDQRQYNRLGLFYFALPDDDVKLDPIMESPVLQREGIHDRFRLHNVETVAVEDWRKARTAAYGQSNLTTGAQAGTEEEVLNGVTVKHYT
ncbi:Clavaminate synthase-like protein [Hysterangium stoloniferum]|nr:Clavaminate synthase-like protein [Hysterangium stoloniferum]